MTEPHYDTVLLPLTNHQLLPMRRVTVHQPRLEGGREVSRWQMSF